MGVRFNRLNEKPLRFVAPIEEAKWNEAWKTFFSTIYLSQKVMSDCGQEIEIHEESFLLSIPKEIYENFEKRSADYEYDYYGRLFVTLDADLYLEYLSNNAYHLGHQLEALQMVPFCKDLPPYIRPITNIEEEGASDTVDSLETTCAPVVNYNNDINLELLENFDHF